MTRFSFTMNDALNFIVNVTDSGHGSEIFIPKMRAYSIMDLKDALTEIFGSVAEELIGIRPGEKLHEVLINNEEIRYGWEYNDMYLITNPLYPLFHIDKIKDIYHGINKIDGVNNYSSDKVEKISKEELKTMIEKIL